SSRDDGKRGEHSLEEREPESLPARRVDEKVGPSKPGRDVRDAAWQENGHVELSGEPLQVRALRSIAEHDQRRVRMSAANVRDRAHSDVEAFLRLEPADRQ